MGKHVPQKYEKVNRLVGRDNMTAAEKDIINYAYYKLRNDQLAHPDRMYTEREMREGIKITIGTNEIVNDIFPEKKLTNNLSRDMRKIAKKLHGYSSVIEGNDEHWISYTLIKTMEYDEGCLTIHFHEQASKYIANLQTLKEGPFTVLDYKVSHALQNRHSKSIYELIEREHKKQKKKCAKMFIDLIDLKVALGVINGDDPKAAALLEKYPLQKEKGYDPKQRLKLMEELMEIDSDLSTDSKRRHRQVCQYNSYNNFKRKCLDIAKEELDGIDFYDLTFHYIPYTAPGTRNIVALYFYIYEKKDKDVYENIDNQMSLNFDEKEDDATSSKSKMRKLYEAADVEGVDLFLTKWSQHMDLPDADLKSKEDVKYGKELIQMIVSSQFEQDIDSDTAMRMMEKADGDMDRIISNIMYTKLAEGNIDSLGGYLVNAVAMDYSNTEKLIHKKSKRKKNSFNDFEQGNTDYAALEKYLLNNWNSTVKEEPSDYSAVLEEENAVDEPVEALKPEDESADKKDADLSRLFENMSEDQIKRVLAYANSLTGKDGEK